MQKHIPLLLAAAALVLLGVAACSGAPASAIPSTVAPTPRVQPAATSAPDQASCSLVSLMPTPGPTEASLFPAPSSSDWSEGPADASVTFTEYSDFQCPYCSSVAPILSQLLKDDPQDVRLVYRHFPLNIHDKALLAAQAAEAAGLQGKFWEMHNLLFDQQSAWAAQTPAQFENWLKSQAPGLGLDSAKFSADLKSGAVVQKVVQAQNAALKIGLSSTPTLLINGRIYTGPADAASLTTIVKLEQLGKRQFTDCPAMQIDKHKQYLATVKTEKGDIVIQLFAGQAPMAVNSFVYLAQHGWFNGVTFHRVLPQFVAQAGDPSGTGLGGPGYAFGNEISQDLHFDKAGVVGMANTGSPNSNGSQFFIAYAAVPSLDGNYTIFGQVIQGMDVAQKLTPRDPSKTAEPPAGDKIIRVTIEEK